MRRPFVTTTIALAVALAPAALFAQTAPPAQQPPATTQPPATAQPATPAAPKVSFATPAGLLLVQVKPDQTAVFEEMVGKIRAGLAKTEDATLKQQAGGYKVYKTTEPFNGNTLYVILAEPTVPASEYEPFSMLQKTMTPDELRAPETAEMWKRYQAAFAAGLGKLSLTPVGGGI
jgi:hypothetical protein